MATYTYDTTKLREYGVARMRFELGDKNVSDGGIHAALSDEEIQAWIDEYPNDWPRARYMAADAIYKQYAHQASISSDGISLQLQQLVENWKQIRDEMQRRASGAPGFPAGADPRNAPDGGHYFSLGLHDYNAG